MSSTQETPLAEAADRRWHLLAIAMLLMAVKSALSAAMLVAENPYLRYLDWAEAATALSAAAIVLWLVFYKLTRMPREQRHHFLHMEGYVRDTIRKACSASWAATFVTLVFLTVLGDRWFLSVPAEFFLQAAIAVMLGVFSVAFFAMNAPGDDDKDIASA